MANYKKVYELIKLRKLLRRYDLLTNEIKEQLKNKIKEHRGKEE